MYSEQYEHGTVSFIKDSEEFFPSEEFEICNGRKETLKEIKFAGGDEWWSIE